MKNMIHFLILTFCLLSPGLGFAKANVANKTCADCEKMNSLTQVLRAKPQQADVDKAVDLILHLQISKRKSTRLQQIRALVQLAAVTLSKDVTGDSDSAFHSMYRENKSEFESVIREAVTEQKLTSDEEKIIRESLKQTEDVSNNGVG